MKYRSLIKAPLCKGGSAEGGGGLSRLRCKSVYDARSQSLSQPIG